jgi:hypothetical protein
MYLVIDKYTFLKLNKVQLNKILEQTQALKPYKNKG